MPDAGRRTSATRRALTGNGNRWVQVPDVALAHRQRRLADPGGRARSSTSRTTSARSFPGLSTATSAGLLLGRHRLDPARPRARPSPRRSRRRSPTTRAQAPHAASVSPYRARREAGRLQLRLVVRLLPAGLRAAGARRCRSTACTAGACRGTGEIHPRGGPAWDHAACRPNRRRPTSLAPIELAERGRGRVRPNPIVGAVIVARRRGARRGLARRATAGRTPRSTRSPPPTAPTSRGATIYVSLEPCCHHGKHAAVHRRDRRRRHRPRRRRLRRPDREGLRAAGSGSCATRAIEVDDRRRRARRPRAAAQPGLPQARAHRPPVGALQVGDDARRQGRHAHRRLEVDLRRGQPRCRAHHWRAALDAVAVGIGTALADDPQLTARIDGDVHASRAASSSTPTARLPLDSQLVAAAPEVPLTVVVSRAAPRTATDALEIAGAEVIVATGENEPARVRSALDQLGAHGITSILLEGGPHLAGAFLDAGEIDEVRLFLAPLRARRPHGARPARGRGRRADRRGAARADARLRARRRRRAGLRAPEGVVSRCSPDSSQISAPSPRSRRPPTACACASRRALAGELARGRLGRGQRRLPDRDAGRRRRASPPTSCTRRCAARRWPRSADGTRGQPRAAAARGRPPRRPHRAGPRRRRRRDRATTAEDGFARVVHDRRAAPELLRYVVEKGSIAVDGVSLTVARVDDDALRRLADPRDARAHEPRRAPRSARRSTWRSTCSPSTWRSSMADEPVTDERAPFATIEEAIEDIRAGKMVVVCDDEDRENEGDLTMAAQFVTPEAINFMAKDGRGLICLVADARALRRARARPDGGQERVAASRRRSPSRSRRARASRPASPRPTARTRSRSRSTPRRAPRDLVQPGHVFPLKAKPGGVLERTGQTEAAVDLARLAGLTPGRRDLRGHERRRHDGARARPDPVLRAPRPEDDHGRRPDRLPAQARQARRARGRDRAADRVRRVQRRRLPLAGRRQAPRRARQGRGRGHGRRARARALRVPHRRRLPLAALRLRRAARVGAGADRARGRRACCSTSPRRAAASACSTSCRPTSCRTAGSTPSTPTSSSACRSTCATTASARRSSSTSGSARSGS